MLVHILAPSLGPAGKNRLEDCKLPLLKRIDLVILEIETARVERLSSLLIRLFVADE